MESSFGRLIGVLFSPGKTFQSIAARPTWGIALLVLAVLAVSSTAVVMHRVDMQDFLAHSKQAEVQQQELPEWIGGLFVWGSAAAGGFMQAVGCLVTAFLFYLLFRLAGSELSYPSSLAATVHGLMPLGVALLLAIPVALGREAILYEDAQVGVLASNLAFVAPEGASMTLKSLLASADLFSFWSLALLVLGYSAVARVTKGKAAAIIVTLWLVYVLGKVGLVAAFT